jgi:hypothetical protein
MSAARERRLHRLLARLVDEPTFDHVITPIFADLEHESRAAASVSRRYLAHARCYLALARVLVFGVRMWNTQAKWTLAVMALTILGIAPLLSRPALLSHYPGQFAPFVVMAVAAPFVLRLARAARSPFQVMGSCAIITIAMVLSMAAYVGNMPRFGFPTRGLITIGITTCVGFVLAAAAAADARSDSSRRRTAIVLLVGAAFYAVIDSTVVLWQLRAYLTWPLGVAVVTSIAGGALLFTVPATLVVLPVVMLLRRRAAASR